MSSASANTLVLVHGFMGSALNWGPILTRLRQDPTLAGWNYLAVDLLGHGGRPIFRTGHEGEPLTLASLGQDFVDQLPPEPVVALGHSFGLRPILCASASSPERFRAIVNEDSSPQMSRTSYELIKNIVDSVPTPLATRDEARAKLLQLFASDPKLAAFLLSNLRRKEESGLYDWRFDKIALLGVLEEGFATPLWPAWESFPRESFVIRGENSTHLSQEGMEECSSRRPLGKCQSFQIERSGHWIHSDQPELFSQLLAKILISLK